MTIVRYMAGNWDTLRPQISTHIEIVAVSIVVAGLVGLILGVLAARSQRVTSVVIPVSSAILTIPSFALFGVLTLWLGIGNRPVEAGLVLYALLPIVRNTRTGILAVDPAITEAALGMSMNRRQVFLQIELPLALPLIIAGLRQAAVLIVAVATVGAAVGSNNLGQPILEGIRGSNREAVLSGMLPVAAIGILADACLGLLQKALTHGRYRVTAA